MKNEEYVIRLLDNIKRFNEILEKKAVVDVAVNSKYIEIPITTDVKKCIEFYNSVMKTIKYYSSIATDTKYVNELYSSINYTMFMLGSGITNYVILLDDLTSEIESYYISLMENKVDFDRSAIPVNLLCDDKPEQNTFIQMVKQDILRRSLTKIEEEIILNNDNISFWKEIINCRK